MPRTRETAWNARGCSTSVSLEQRFGAGMAADPTSDPGLIQEADGSVWVVDTDGTRTRLPDGGSGGANYDGGNATSVYGGAIVIDGGGA